MNLQSHWQTFFTGVVVIGAVLLDMYRTRKTSEVRIETEADQYRRSMEEKIAALKQERAQHASGGRIEDVSRVSARIAEIKRELKVNFARLKAEEKAEQVRLRAEERAAEQELARSVKGE